MPLVEDTAFGIKNIKTQFISLIILKKKKKKRSFPSYFGVRKRVEREGRFPQVFLLMYYFSRRKNILGKAIPCLLYFQIQVAVARGMQMRGQRGLRKLINPLTSVPPPR